MNYRRILIRISIYIGLIIFVLGIMIFIIPDDGVTKGKTRDAKREFDMNVIQSTLGLYKNKYDTYPKSLETLKSKDSKISIIDPKTNLSYEYQTKLEENDYRLCIDFEKEEDKCVSASDCKMCGEKTPQWILKNWNKQK